MTIFDEFKTYIGDSSISFSLFEEYDLVHFDWWKSRKIVAQRIIERKSLKDFYTASKLYNNIERFREIIKEMPSFSPQYMNFVCVIFNSKKEKLKCNLYTELLRDRLLNT